MPKRPLPEHPSLENLRKQAKRLLAEARAGEEEAVALLREFHPSAPRGEELANVAVCKRIAARLANVPIARRCRSVKDLWRSRRYVANH